MRGVWGRASEARSLVGKKGLPRSQDKGGAHVHTHNRLRRAFGRKGEAWSDLVWKGQGAATRTISTKLLAPSAPSHPSCVVTPLEYRL